MLDVDAGVHYVHEHCRGTYNNKKNIAKYVASMRSNSPAADVEPPDNIDAANVADFLPAVRNESAVISVGIRPDLASLPFDFGSLCFVCGTNFGRGMKVSKLSAGYAESKLLMLCANSKDPQATEVTRRVKGVDLAKAGARYHWNCYKLLLQQLEEAVASQQTTSTAAQLVTVQDQNIPTVSTSAQNIDWASVIPPPDKQRPAQQIIDPAQQLAASTSGAQQDHYVSSSVWTVVDCGAARSHADYLERVAAANHQCVLVTESFGNCFYDAIRQELADRGNIVTIPELRLIAAARLRANQPEWEERYVVEDNGQHEQAPTYDLFVDRTERGREWATEMSVAALAEGMDIVIRVIRTMTDDDGSVTAQAQLYDEGVVRRQSILTVGFNSAEGHYIGFRALPAPVALPAPATWPARRASSRLSFASRALSSMDYLSSLSESGSLMDIPSISSNAVDMDFDDLDDEVFLQAPASVSQPATSVRGSVAMSTDSQPSRRSDAISTASQQSVPATVLMGECASCRRTETADCPLKLQLHTDNFIRRQYCQLPAGTEQFHVVRSVSHISNNKIEAH